MNKHFNILNYRVFALTERKKNAGEIARKT